MFYRSGIEEITIPESVLEIDDWAFFDSSVRTINYRGTREQWEQINISEGKLEDVNINYEYKD